MLQYLPLFWAGVPRCRHVIGLVCALVIAVEVLLIVVASGRYYFWSTWRVVELVAVIFPVVFMVTLLTETRRDWFNPVGLIILGKGGGILLHGVMLDYFVFCAVSSLCNGVSFLKY